MRAPQRAQYVHLGKIHERQEPILGVRNFDERRESLLPGFYRITTTAYPTAQGRDGHPEIVRYLRDAVGRHLPRIFELQRLGGVKPKFRHKRILTEKEPSATLRNAIWRKAFCQLRL